MTFFFTDHTAVNSSAVEDVYYNMDSEELAVALTSGQGYVYSDVPAEVYEKFETGGVLFSAGRYYAKTVKPEYGPGKSLGYVDYYDFVEADAADELDAEDEFGSDELVSAGARAVGTPKALTYSEDAKVTNSGNFYIDLDGGVSVGGTSSPFIRHTVNFTLDDSLFAHTVHANSVAEAVDAFREVMMTLGMSHAKVKEVVTHFDN